MVSIRDANIISSLIFIALGLIIEDYVPVSMGVGMLIGTFTLTSNICKKLAQPKEVRK